MSVLITSPNITATSAQGQAEQIRRYLYQLSEQLNFALNDLSVGQAGGAVNPVTGTATEAVGGKNDPQTTFNEIKALIIKSADIVNAYYEKISAKLAGEYVAQSDFGTFVERTEQDIQANSTAIEQFYTDTQSIITDIESVEHSLIEVNAHIKTGLLYYDESGTPVYGLEIGQRNEIDGEEVFDKYARFTSEKLSFYDANGIEVAYISDRKLYITHIEVTGSFSQGGFVDTVLSDRSVVTKWVGGDG